jgi:predicted porin
LESGTNRGLKPFRPPSTQQVAPRSCQETIGKKCSTSLHSRPAPGFAATGAHRTTQRAGFELTEILINLFGDWKAGLVFSMIDNNAGKKTNNWMVSGAYTLGSVALKANYGASRESSGAAADDLTLAGVEVDYTLDKSITLYGQYSQITNSKNAKAYYTQVDNFPATAAGKNPTALNFGIQYTF